jgi:hypothetical protein
MELIDTENQFTSYLCPLYDFSHTYSWVGVRLTGSYYAPRLADWRSEPRCDLGIIPIEVASPGERSGFRRGENRGAN